MERDIVDKLAEQINLLDQLLQGEYMTEHAAALITELKENLARLQEL